MGRKCEKHSKKEEAVEKLRNGAKFDDVAKEFSEDKARQGWFVPVPFCYFPFTFTMIPLVSLPCMHAPIFMPSMYHIRIQP